MSPIDTLTLVRFKVIDSDVLKTDRRSFCQLRRKRLRKFDILVQIGAFRWNGAHNSCYVSKGTSETAIWRRAVNLNHCLIEDYSCSAQLESDIVSTPMDGETTFRFESRKLGSKGNKRLRQRKKADLQCRLAGWSISHLRILITGT